MTYPSGTGRVLWSCSKISKWSKYLEKLAEWTGLEPATSCVTGSFSPFRLFSSYSILGYFRPSFRVVTTLLQSAIRCRRTPHKIQVSGTVLVLARSINFGELGRPDSERLPISIGQIRRNFNFIFINCFQLGGFRGGSDYRDYFKMG